ncbi:MAG: hypothetical protein DRP81_06250 [Candidatus Omnitrophota bacterium]|nr:MAG: hypothetical protein DRP81_06250 [Candidatus Omnitrophota bacterium]
MNKDDMISHSSRSAMNITVYKVGKETKLNEHSPYFKKLQSVCENLLITANNRLWEFIPPETISNIKNNEIAIEIIYRSPQHFKTSFEDGHIQLDRLLIPLSGYYVFQNKQLTIIYGYQTYSPGPFINTKGFYEIKELLEAMDIKLD